MKFNFEKEVDVRKARIRLEQLIKNKKRAELTEEKEKRTPTQNRALHLFFKFVANSFNNLGISFTFTGLKGIEMEIPYSENLVKETIWRPIQITLFDIKSTKDISTEHINVILDILTKYFAERGILISFPSQIGKIAEELKDRNYL